MFDDIYTRALQYVWAARSADRQYQLRPAAITIMPGDYVKKKMLTGTLVLPTSDMIYMVYDFGLRNPKSVGLPEDLSEWVSLHELTDSTGRIVYLTSGGVRGNNNHIYLRQFKDGAMYMAVAYTKNEAMYAQGTTVTLTIYNNSWYDTNQAGAQVDSPYELIQDVGTDRTVINSILTEQTAQREAGNYPLMFWNGALYSDITPAETASGDRLTLLVDKSIVGYWDFPIRDLRSYQKGGKLYYLLNAPDNREYVRHRNDLDIYMMATSTYVTTVTRYIGAEIIQDNSDTINQLTRCDFSIDSDYVDALIDSNGWFEDVNDPFIRIYYRKNDEARPYYQDSNYSNFLCQLPVTQVFNYMAGYLALITGWKASDLQNSNYNNFIEMTDREMYVASNNPQTSVTGILSYYGLYDIIEGRICKDGDLFPVMSEGNVAVTYYDEAGYYVDTVWYTDKTMADTITMPDGAVYAECFAGGKVFKNLTAWTTRFSKTSDLLEEDHLIRRYWKTQYGSLVEAIEGTDYTILGNYAIWDSSIASVSTTSVIRRRAGDVLLQTFMVDRDQIGVGQDWLMISDVEDLIPFGAIDVFVNKRRATPSIDYIIDGENQFYLTSREWFDNDESETVEVIIRRHGIDHTDQDEYLAEETSWVEHGMVSRNDKFDFYAEAGNLIFIDGRLTTKVIRGETTIGENEDWVEDGMQVYISKREQHFANHLLEDLGASRARDVAFLTAAANSVNNRLPQPEETGPIILKNGLYSTVSPLMSSIINMLTSGELVVQAMLNMTQVAGLVVGNETLFLLKDADPFSDYDDDGMYVVHAHGMTGMFTATAMQYAFLESVNTLYMNGCVRISESVAIAG